jgi:hypothetical protein
MIRLGYHDQDSLILPVFFSLHGIHVAFYSALLSVRWFPRPFSVRGIPVVFYSSLPSLSSLHHSVHLQVVYLLL